MHPEPPAQLVLPEPLAPKERKALPVPQEQRAQPDRLGRQRAAEQLVATQREAARAEDSRPPHLVLHKTNAPSGAKLIRPTQRQTKVCPESDWLSDRKRFSECLRQTQENRK